jgi:hypothetical protein
MNKDLGRVSELAVRAWAARGQGQCAMALYLVARAARVTAAEPRRVRQAVEVVSLVVHGDATRARGLAAEHLVEFPDDGLVRQVLEAT